MSDSETTPENEPVSDSRSRIEDILAADDVTTATARFEEFLKATDSEVTPLDEGEGNGHDRDKVVVDGEDTLFLKSPRPKDDEVVIVDMFCELVIARAAEYFQVPVLPVSLIEYEEPALVMRWLEEDLKKDRPNDQPKDFSNADELSLLYVFEVWVGNFDDTDEHFRIDQTDTSEEIKILDHGHALYRNKYQEIEGTDDLEQLLQNQNVGDSPGMYGVNSFEDVRDSVEEVHNVPMERIEEFVEWALDQLRSVDNPKVDEFLENEELHRELATQMLKDRRDDIDEHVKKHVD